ncbi:MAG: 2-oxoacid:acceptor oxidoreductase subunit alpha [Candidatus Erginobacter occultus]|nr:2-oxoacid:acceptor oxidoreductase subunit alpha [Candidatus Erginobacter occultus]
MREDVSIVICGQAGQGIKTLEGLLAKIFSTAGFNIFTTREFMSRIRGGMNSTAIRVSSSPVQCYSRRVDILVSLHIGGVAHLGDRVGAETLILGDEGTVSDGEKKGRNFASVAGKEIAKELGGAVYANTVSVGAISGVLGLDGEAAEKVVESYFSRRDEEIREKNLRAFRRGQKRGREIAGEKELSFPLKSSKKKAGEVFLNGTQGVALGAIAGGCNFLSFYPMSPATGVGVFLAGKSEEFGIEVIQAEDEISAVNMALGAWYAGGRGLVTTSGGGFALMNEGLSLAGMIESPLVIHLAQRPGPATGLPTRTEQGDLLFTLFAGHGEFPRAILSPGTIEECFDLTRRAFLLADRWQVPVIVLTDQYLLDSAYNFPLPEIPEEKIENRIIETEKDYRRYDPGEDGVSPRGIPGHGKGLVLADSDEHDRHGRITEDFGVRVEMVDKRAKKLTGLTREALEPEFFGDENYRTLVVGWGSTYPAIRESLEKAGEKGIGGLHFRQVYPLHPKTADYLRRAEKTIVIENNPSGQFARLLKMTFGVETGGGLRKYNGLPFSREEISQALDQEADNE